MIFILEKNKSFSIKSSTITPIISGSASFWLLHKVLFSEMDEVKFYIAVASTFAIFLISAIVFGVLKWGEKQKDEYLLNMVGKIVEYVFKDYGVAMASNAAGPDAAAQMNPIMQTIVNLTEGLRRLAEKGYTEK